MSPHNFLTCFFFSRSEAETGFGLKDMGGRRGGAVEIAVGTMMEKRERARCGCCGCGCGCGCGCFDAATTGTTVDFLPAAIEAHEDEDEDGFSCFFGRGTFFSSSWSSLSLLLSRTPNGLFFLL